MSLSYNYLSIITKVVRYAFGQNLIVIGASTRCMFSIMTIIICIEAVSGYFYEKMHQAILGVLMDKGKRS